MGVVCYLVTAEDKSIRHYVDPGNPIDPVIDEISEYWSSRGTEYFGNESSLSTIDKSWYTLQYALYPDHHSDRSHVLSKAIAHATPFTSPDRRACYLFSDEVKETWLALKELTADDLLRNIDTVIERGDYWDEEEDEEDRNDKLVKSYALHHFSHLLSTYYSAQANGYGIIIYYSG